MFAAAVSHGLVLNAAPYFVEGVVAQPHDMERVRDLGRVGHRSAERGPIGAREVQRRPADLIEPFAGAAHQPPCGPICGAAWDYVEQLA